MKTAGFKKSLIAVIIGLAIVSCGNISCSKKQNVANNEQAVPETINIDKDTASKTIKTENIKEMQPKLGRLLEFPPQMEKDWQRCVDFLESVGHDFEKLTAQQKTLIEKMGYCETKGGPWDIIGGGCSWYCGGGPSKVTASSYLKSNNPNFSYVPQNAHDLSYKTAWVEGVKGHGIGEYLTYYFSATSARVTEIIIANGIVVSEKLYRDNSRVKKLKMYINNKPVAILNLKDVRREQTFSFEPIGRFYPVDIDQEELAKLPDWTLKFEILEVYPGDKYEDTAITQIYFSGIDVHCFAAGTKILMQDNSLKNIELIKEGDIVKSYDFKNKKLIDSKVTKLVSATHCNLLKLKFADNEIITTADHPFWIDKNIWAAVDAEKANKNYFQKTKVGSLKIGDKIFIPQKNIFSEILEIEPVNMKQITYTIELAESDNFIANGLLVKTEIVK